MECCGPQKESGAHPKVGTWWTSSRLQLLTACREVFRLLVCEAGKLPNFNIRRITSSQEQYPKNDPNHQANGIKSVIRGSYTSDFNNFDPPFTYLDANPMSVIDMSILHLGGNTYVRFIKNEADNSVFSEISTGGLDGQWSRKGVIEKEVEGPAPYLDNQVKGKGHLLLDFFGRGGYRAYESDDIPSGQWRKSCSGFPGGLRHGFVVPVDQRQYDGLSQRYR